MAAEPRAVAFGDRISDLTTVFTPPCPTTWLLTTTKVPSQYPRFPTAGPASCDPPSWEDNISQKGFAYYSPAICPSGFAAGCTISHQPPAEGFQPVSAGETGMYCIPSGFTCTSDTTDFRGGVWGYLRTATASGASVTVGPAIQIRWREQDLANLATDPLSPGTPTTLPPSASSFTTAPEMYPVQPIQPVRPTPETSSETEVSEPRASEPVGYVVVSPPPPTSERSSSIVSPTGVGPAVTSTSEAVVPGPSQTDVTTSDPPGPTSTAGEGGTQTPGGPDRGQSEGGTPDVVSSTSVAAMAMSGILILMILGFLAFGLLRRYRRYRAGETETFVPWQLGTRVKRIFGRWRARLRRADGGFGKRPSKNIDAELGTDGPTPELGAGAPLGTKENPAELEETTERNSWASRMSRVFTARLKKEVWST
ncbi:hypothetical protein GGS23DRAFT_203199 [Durotheca rogersii]|uniref:uncharacterized protein n=1 Tax=Durotheca rogersii TaxID=419775 RepID=UPI0022202DA9|nr:uncharacterized protein GGS23DRAFT_203199 [Durotheca rogersii]KAI5860962.1 hypothetical protein GGS23DRAFT_203199 [Durotheca rogersii]